MAGCRFSGGDDTPCLFHMLSESIEQGVEQGVEQGMEQGMERHGMSLTPYS